MISIWFYHFDKYVNSLDKGLQSSTRIDNVVLKIPTDLAKPVIMVDVRNLGGAISFITNFNYAWLPSVKRYYFIDSTTIINDDLLELHLHCDVLISFKDIIMKNDAFVLRNEKNWNLTIEDKQLSYYSVKQTAETEIATIFTTNAPGVAEQYIALTTIIDWSNSAIMSDIIAGVRTLNPTLTTDEQALNAITERESITPTSGNLEPVSTKRISPETYSYTYLLNLSQFQYVQEACLKDDALNTYIKGCTAWPLALQNIIPNEWKMEVVMGQRFVEGETVSGRRLHVSTTLSKWGSQVGYVKVATFDMERKYDFVDNEPYRTMQIYLPYYGWADITFSSMFPENLPSGLICHYDVFYSFDLNTGEGQVLIYRNNFTPRVVFSSPINMGIRLAVNSTNNRENEIARTNNAVNTALGVIGSAVGLGVSIATGNPIGAIGSVAGLAGSVAKGATSSMAIRDKGQVSYNSPSLANFNPLNVYIRETYIVPTISRTLGSQEFSDYAKRFGYPLCKVVTLNTLEGFTVCENFHLTFNGITTNSPRPTREEQLEIEALLNTGVYLPYNS